MSELEIQTEIDQLEAKMQTEIDKLEAEIAEKKELLKHKNFLKLGLDNKITDLKITHNKTRPRDYHQEIGEVVNVSYCYDGYPVELNIQFDMEESQGDHYWSYDFYMCDFSGSGSECYRSYESGANVRDNGGVLSAIFRPEYDFIFKTLIDRTIFVNCMYLEEFSCDDHRKDTDCSLECVYEFIKKHKNNDESDYQYIKRITKDSGFNSSDSDSDSDTEIMECGFDVYQALCQIESYKLRHGL